MGRNHWKAVHPLFESQPKKGNEILINDHSIVVFAVITPCICRRRHQRRHRHHHRHHDRRRLRQRPRRRRLCLYRPSFLTSEKCEEAKKSET